MAINKVTLTINSRQYTVVADESEEYIEKLCNHINEKVDEVRKGGQNILGERPIVLAALNICDEYFKTREAVKKTERELEVYKLQASNMKSAQMSIDDGSSNNALNAAKTNLETAQRRIRQLEGHIKDLENRLRSQQNQGRKY